MSAVVLNPNSDLVRLRVWGDFACFTRPEMKVERVSYPVMTPSAARGVLEAILARPVRKPDKGKELDRSGFRWEVRSIGIVKAGEFISFRRNEVQHKVSAKKPVPIDILGDRTQRNTLALRGIEYLIEAAIVIPTPDQGSTLVKYREMFLRRASRGQCYHRPYLGCREFAADFELAGAEDRPDPNIHRDFGRILYDLDYEAAWRAKPGPLRPLFFEARAEDGIVAIPPLASVRAAENVGGGS